MEKSIELSKENSLYRIIKVPGTGITLYIIIQQFNVILESDWSVRG